MTFDPVPYYRANHPVRMRIWPVDKYVLKCDNERYASFADMAHMVLTPSEWELYVNAN